ncbi:hypothetical protein ALC56_05319 [Trachymyrmex septentrionalis]|uniref:Uncharacterized protein n=1 Tax=Trachymyrmex septentrionalis TaxID=34720 RepID=A0A195FK44_9HYME|nr:hypothetical protein ALC56_05319 [Trachymyrmex septentrionalis]
MFPERGRMKDIRPGMPRRLDDELVRRGGCLAENFRCILHVFVLTKIPGSLPIKHSQKLT